MQPQYLFDFVTMETFSPWLWFQCNELANVQRLFATTQKLKCMQI